MPYSKDPIKRAQQIARLIAMGAANSARVKGTKRPLPPGVAEKIGNANRGKPKKPRSAEACLRLSAALKGKKKSPEHVAKMRLAWAEGRVKRGPYPASWRENCKAAQQLRFANHIYKNENSRACPEYKAWRTAVLRRDGYKCRYCDVTKKQLFQTYRSGPNASLHAHHIKPWKDFPELCFEVANGITLCPKCHYDLHHKPPIERILIRVRVVLPERVRVSREISQSIEQLSNSGS